MLGTVQTGDGVPGGPCTANCVELDVQYAVWFNGRQPSLRLYVLLTAFSAGFEIFSVAVFTIEYVLRIWSSMEFEEYRKLGRLLGRLRYMVTFFW